MWKNSKNRENLTLYMKNKITGISFILAFTALSLFTYAQGVETERAWEPVRMDLLPKPVSQKFTDGVFLVGKGTSVVSGGNVEFVLHRYLEQKLLRSFPDDWRKSPSEHQNSIRLVMPAGKNIPAEGYNIEITEDNIIIEADDRGGLFYGIQTFLQLMPAGIYTGEKMADPCALPCQTITDRPFLGYRGVMLDVARTFIGKDEVMKFIDVMSMHKLNRLHWHLADDEGWRIELKSFPQLAEKGGYRGGDSPVKPIYGEWDKKYGGYYTQEDIKEIVEYAAFRNVEVIPEIDLPGHSRAIAKVFPEILCGNKPNTSSSGGDDRRNVWCASKESNYEMLGTIIGEVAALFPSPYFHIGGDEVLLGQWNGCPDCKKLVAQKGYKKTKQLTDYFISKVGAILEKNGKTACVWDEGAESGDLDKKYRVYGWQGIKQCIDVTGKGYKTVVMPGHYFYLDMRQDPEEDGQTWSGVVDAEKLYSFGLAKTGFKSDNIKNVLGVQGCFFSELLLSHEPGYLWYMAYPRVTALAEVGWTPEKQRNWPDFYSRLTGSHLGRLDAVGAGYRLTPPEVNYSKGVITAVAPFAGAEVRYTVDGGEPEAGSALYTEPIKDNDPRRYRFRAFYNGTASASKVPTGKSRHTLAASATSTFNVPLPEVADTEGLWYLRIRTGDANMRIAKIAVAAPDTSYNILGVQGVSELHRIRYYATEKSLPGTMAITLRNLDDFPCGVVFEFEKSPYIEPKVTVTSSMTANTRFPFKNLQDYNFTSYGRTASTCKKGDHITFTFAQPVAAEEIEVVTGLSYMPRYHIPFGRVQASTDGVAFKDAAELVQGRAFIYPEGDIKAVRIVSDSDGNSEGAVAIQDLKIKPRKR